MKNIHILPTDKPSRLVKIYNDVDRETFTLKLDVEVNDSFKEYVNIYITSDEEIKDGDYYYDNIVLQVRQWKSFMIYNNVQHFKIILTTDQDLIEDGVQEIDDEFLEWFVKNPNCEEIEVVDVRSLGVYGSYYPYKINITKEDPKQETLEEVAKKYHEDNKYKSNYPHCPQSFIDGAKWQQEQNKNLYSEEDMHKLMYEYQEWLVLTLEPVKTFEEWFKQFKKK